MQVRRRAARVAAAALRHGRRTVLWVPERIYLGNFLYHWLIAHREQASGRDVVARATAAMNPWRPLVPGSDRLVVDPSAVRFVDRRRLGYFQEFGVDYTAAQLSRFIDDVLLDSPLVDLPRSVELSRDDLAVNVRRGDYYARGAFQDRFGFDVLAHLRRAVQASLEIDGPARRIHVISDDMTWCRSELGWLAELGPLTFAGPDDGPRDNFAVLARARRIVATNSTFGYWAAHVSSRFHAGNERSIVMPAFHDRMVNDGRAYQLNPAWTVVGDATGA